MLIGIMFLKSHMSEHIEEVINANYKKGDIISVWKLSQMSNVAIQDLEAVLEELVEKRVIDIFFQTMCPSCHYNILSNSIWQYYPKTPSCYYPKELYYKEHSHGCPICKSEILFCKKI